MIMPIPCEIPKYPIHRQSLFLFSLQPLLQHVDLNNGYVIFKWGAMVRRERECSRVVTPEMATSLNAPISGRMPQNPSLDAPQLLAIRVFKEAVKESIPVLGITWWRCISALQPTILVLTADCQGRILWQSTTGSVHLDSWLFRGLLLGYILVLFEPLHLIWRSRGKLLQTPWRRYLNYMIYIYIRSGLI